MIIRPGAIALAAYRPDEELFTRQLRSIQAQTIENWTCIISSDGEAQAVSDAVQRAVHGDSRFIVSGHDNRLGFYLNFERALRAVPADASWIALSDQDDVWNPEKLERLVPLLSDHTMVSGQARIVDHPSGRVISDSTRRANADALNLATMNQFSGAMSVFRPEVLDLAMPFPIMASPVEVHDQWLAVCAAVVGTTQIVGDVLQDYVQHSANVLGEASAPVRFRVGSAWEFLVAQSERYRGSSAPIEMLRTLYDMGFGWRALMADTLLTRRPIGDPAIEPILEVYGRRPRWISSFRHFAAGTYGSSGALMLAAGRLVDCVERSRSLTPRVH